MAVGNTSEYLQFSAIPDSVRYTDKGKKAKLINKDKEEEKRDFFF